MPIKIPSTLPAHDVLSREGVMVMSAETAQRQDIRPLEIALLNLMPNKVRTETQIARLIGATPLQINFTLLRMTEHRSKNTPLSHMKAFYTTVAEAKTHKYDGLIVTGAPIELLPFEEVRYWDELTSVFDWTQTNVHSTFAICWGGQAMIHHLHGVEKHELSDKAFGCFQHHNCLPNSPYLRGFSDEFTCPVSRWTEVREEELPTDAGLNVLMKSDEAGLCMVEDARHRALYMFNHIEYDTSSLDEEYRRDLEKGVKINVPSGYYPGDDPANPPENRWRSHAHLLFGNWINQVYQTTPYDLSRIGD